jgi:hypothetical protein
MFELATQEEIDKLGQGQVRFTPTFREYCVSFEGSRVIIIFILYRKERGGPPAQPGSPAR